MLYLNQDNEKDFRYRSTWPRKSSMRCLSDRRQVTGRNPQKRQSYLNRFFDYDVLVQ
jgi:hypothetical protein